MFGISRRLCQKNIQQSLSVARRLIKHNYPIRPRKQFLIQDKIRNQHLTPQKCDFRTTRSLRSSGVCIFLGFVLRFAAFLMGRRARRWWARKSEEEKEEYKERFRERRNVVLGTKFLEGLNYSVCMTTCNVSDYIHLSLFLIQGCFGLYSLVLLIYYTTHLETDPLTKRSRFNMFDKEYEKYLGQIVFEDQIETYKDYLLSETHPNYRRIRRVIKKLVSANSDIKSMRETRWTLSVIDKSSADISYAYALPGGHIFVASDALKIVENDDQLAFLLAHEIAHSLLLHSLEALSQKVLWDFLTVIPIFFIWSLLSDIKATVVHLLGEQIVNIAYKLPHRRILEREADDIGIKLAAKACFDVREAVVFWATLRTLTEMRILPPDLSWISSHPDHGDREKTLNRAMVKALELRKNSGCSVLPKIDPRDKFYKRSTTEHRIYFRERGIIP